MNDQHTSYVLPAEWATQSGIQLTWPHENTDWAPYLDAITDTFIQLAREIARQEKLIIAARNPEEVERILRQHIPEDHIKNIRIFECYNNDTWARDHAPLTLMPADTKTNNAGEPMLLDFKFNGWGEKFEWQHDNCITRSLFDQQAFNGNIKSYKQFVLEGGSIESDGKGTIMTTSFCLLAPNRNQPMNQNDIEHRLINYFNARRVVWLHHGKLVGDDTDGHIDTIVRLCPNDTIVYQGCDDKEDEQFTDFKLLEDELRKLSTLNGESYKLLKLPMPDAIFDDGQRLPATYANFVILNRSVIVPAYQQKNKDTEAARIIKQAFPDKEVVCIDATTVVRQHGSLHCLTMQYPCGVIK